jgi:hypothetical protein
VAVAAPAMAQQAADDQQPTAPAKAAKAGPSGATFADNKGDLSFQYAYLRITPKQAGTTKSDQWESYPSGWAFAGAKRLARGISLVAKVSGYIGDDIVNVDPRQNQTPSKVFMYEGGARFSTKSNSTASGGHLFIKPFAEILYGGANDNADQMNHFSAMTVGGGVDLQVSQSFSIRVQAGMPMFFFFGPVHLGYNFAVGIVKPFHKAQ